MDYKVELNYNVAVVHLNASDFTEHQLVDEDLYNKIADMPLVVILFTDANDQTTYITAGRDVYNNIAFVLFQHGSDAYTISAVNLPD